MTELLRCPVTGQALAPAPPAVVAALRARRETLRNRDGEPPADFETGLQTGDAAWFYPVRDGIPVLLPGEAMAMPPADA